MKTYITGLFVVTAILLSGCHSESKKETHSSEEKHQHIEGEGYGHENGGEHADEISFTKEQAEFVGLSVETVSPGIFLQVIKTSGQIQTAQGDEITVAATSNGTVSFAGPAITEGSAIGAGEAIVTISAKNILEGDPVEKAGITFETAQKEFQRAEKLVEDRIISVKEYEQAQLRYETAKTAYEAQASNVTAKGVKISSPVNGYIKNRFVAQGEYVSVGQPIVTVTQNKRLQLKAEVFENDFKSLKNISSANFKLPYDNAVYRLSDLNGRLLSYGKTTSRQSFYIPVMFDFDNTGDIIPGLYAEVFLLSNPISNVISVPVSAITEEQGLFFVYIQLDEEGYKKQEITPGHNDGERVQILTGLNEGDRVVTKGVFQVKLAATSSVVPEGHSHSH